MKFIPPKQLTFKNCFCVMLFAASAMSITACKEEIKDELGKQNSQEATEPFVLPDSIDTSLLIAMFDETDPPGHSILMYTDSSKTAAKKIMYLLNHTTSTEQLTPTRYRELKSNATNTVYMIRDKSVATVRGGQENTGSPNLSVGGMAVLTEHRRTDTHLREYDIVIDQGRKK